MGAGANLDNILIERLWRALKYELAPEQGSEGLQCGGIHKESGC
jgi:hypothetical protein